jgi:hypothetical protein
MTMFKMHCLSHQQMLEMQKNGLTVSEAAWALAKLINGPRPHLPPNSSSLLVPLSSQSSHDTPIMAMPCVTTLLPNDAQEWNLKLQQTSHFGQCVLDIKVCYSAVLCTPNSNKVPRKPGEIGFYCRVIDL